MMHLIFVQISPLGPILENMDMSAIFKCKEMLKKGKILENVGKKCTKLENILKKGRWLHVIIARSKLLE